MAKLRLTPRTLIIIIILLAFGLRLYHLTWHSLWFDEAVSVYWAKQSVARILEVGFTLEEDRLPPLYYLTLKGWGQLAGWSEFAVRLPSVGYGVLLIPVVAGLGAMLFNRRAALMAAALTAVNPFLIWYSQEARMYAPAVFWSALAVWACLRACRAASRRSGLAFGLLFVLAATAALYSHLYAGFLLPGLGLWLLLAYPRRWRWWLAFAAAGGLIALAYLPILRAIWRFSAEATPGDPLTGLGERGWWLLQSFVIWKAPLSSPTQTALILLVLGFVAAAFLPAPAAGLPRPRLLVALLLAAPFVIANGLLLRNYLAFFGERYFIVMTPWLLLLAAVGADNLGQRIPAGRWTRLAQLAPFGLLFIATLLPAPGQWSLPAAKEAWRQSVDWLAAHATAADGILIHPDWVRYPFQFYFTGPGQTYAAFSTVTVETPLDGPLQGVVGEHSVIWLIQSHLDAPDPERRVEQWLAARYPLVTELYPPGISLKGYAPGYQSNHLPPEAIPTDIMFSNGLRLAGYQTEAVVSATDELFHPPSGWLHVILYWQAARPIEAEAAPVVQVVGPEGVWGASLDRPTDALKLFPPSRWPVGELFIRQDVDVNLNPATPPGRYQVVVGLSGTAESFPLTEVEVQ
jgi:4-amino-4-deoxy-L-arabinose transferase-like glycosyltransferase